MIVKFLLPQTDMDARALVVQFKNDGIASLSFEGLHYGFIRQVGEERGKIMIVTEVTNPDLMDIIKKNISGQEPLEIEVGPERGRQF